VLDARRIQAGHSGSKRRGYRLDSQAHWNPSIGDQDTKLPQGEPMDRPRPPLRPIQAPDSVADEHNLIQEMEADVQREEVIRHLVSRKERRNDRKR